MAAFDSMSLRRSPFFIRLPIDAKRKCEASFGSPSSPLCRRTPHAMLNDCSNSSVSDIASQRRAYCHVPALRAKASRNRSTRSLPAKRCGPASHLLCTFEFGCPAQQSILLHTGRRSTGFLSQSFNLRRRSLIKPVDIVAAAHFLFLSRGFASATVCTVNGGR